MAMRKIEEKTLIRSGKKIQLSMVDNCWQNIFELQYERRTDIV